MNRQMVLASISLCIIFPTAGITAEAVSQPGASEQRAACDAQCRENYQNNSTALEACLRDCGAVGPASPAGAKAAGHEAAHTVQQTSKVKGSKSNTSERQASPVTPPPTPAEASNLNLSKSNINRVAEPAGSGAQPAEATTVKSTKSNSSDRMAPPLDKGETPPVELQDDAPADG